MDLSLKGKQAVVCGSTQGIGKASALELAALGAEITLIARDETKLKQSLTELSTQAVQTHSYLVADFSKPETVSAAIGQFVSRHTAHILINNTGGPPAGPGLPISAAISSAVILNRFIAARSAATDVATDGATP